MKPILFQLGRLTLALSVLYGALLALSAVVTPPDADSSNIDTSRASTTAYLTEPKYVFFARSKLDTERAKLLLLGASNTMAGFKQRELAPLLPAYEVHNLSVGGANITELAQIVDLVREVESTAARRQDTYVLGLWYGVFASDRARWHTSDRHAGDTDIDIERYRYGFYRRTENGPIPLLPPRHLSTGEALIRPYLVLDRAARDMTASLRAGLSGKAPKLNDEARNLRVISVAEQRGYLEFWHRYMGEVQALGDEPFDRLAKLVKTIVSDGGRVVLVDLPIPSWHSRGASLDRDYRQRLERMLPSLSALPGVRVLCMAGENADEDFSDEVHPKPRVSPRWAARLAAALQLDSGNEPITDPTASNDHG